MSYLFADAYTSWLLGQNPLLDSISNAFSTGPSKTEVVTFIASALALVLLILLAARIFGRGAAESEPSVNYLTVAVDILDLSEVDRRTLQKIARKTDMREPAAMLLSPENLAQAAAPIWRTGLDHAARQRLENLSRRLFDAPLPPPDQLR